MLRRSFRRLLYGPPIVVVSGLPRSGTSMAMRMLAAGGLETVEDGQRTADTDNPMGYFEDQRVRDLASAEDKTWLRHCRGRAIKIISYLLKDLPAENNYKVIVMRRELSEVLASQATMLDHRKLQDDVSNEEMARNLEALNWRAGYVLRRNPQFESLEVDFGEAIKNPQRQAERITSFLGGELDAIAMAGAVDPNLYRNRAEG